MEAKKRSSVTVSRKLQTFRRDLKRDRSLLLIMLPALVHIFLFCYMPIYGITVSFRDFRLGDPFFALGSEANWVGFKHFFAFFKSIFFERVITNTVILNAVTLVFTFWVPIAFALLLNEIMNHRFKKMVQSFSYLPYFVSSVIIVSIALNLFAKDGVINDLVAALGGERTYFFGSTTYFRPLYILLNVWKTFGWNAIVYLASISSVPPELYEAASMDGANRWKKMLHITLPGIMPTVITMFILNMGSLMSSNTELILLMTNPNNIDVADVIGTYAYRMGVVDGQFSYATAIGFFSAVINFALLSIANRIVNKKTGEGLW